MAVVLLAAAAVWALPGGSAFASLVIELLGAAMLAAVAYSAWRFGREHSFELERIEWQGRALVYGTGGLLALAMVGRQVLWSTVLGSVIWIVMIGFVVAGAVVSWRLWRDL